MFQPHKYEDLNVCFYKNVSLLMFASLKVKKGEEREHLWKDKSPNEL